jgi:hypothetical protein
MTKPVNTNSPGVPFQSPPSIEEQSQPAESGRTEQMHQVKVQFEAGSKDKASNLFESTKESISSFFSNFSSNFQASSNPVENQNEGILSKIANILSRIFSFFTNRKVAGEGNEETKGKALDNQALEGSTSDQTAIREESATGKESIRDSLVGKEIASNEVPIQKGNETLLVTSQFHRDLSRSNITWNGQLLMTKGERAIPEVQYDACKKMENELGVQGFKNISLVMNQASFADALGNLILKYANDKEMIFGLNDFPEHQLEYQLDATDPNEVKLTIRIDFALAEIDKVSNLRTDQNVKDTNPRYIAYKREITIPRSELSTDWKLEAHEIAPGLKVVDHISKPSASYEEAKNSVA